MIQTAGVTRPTLEQARKYLVDAANADSNDPVALVELAMFDMQTRDTAAAERELVEAWHRFPHSARAPYRLGLLYLSSERDVAALPPLQAAAALSPGDPQILENAAVACLRAGRAQDAKKYALAALRADPRYADPYLVLAGMNDHLGTAEVALNYVRGYLKYSPNPAPGYYMMARLYARRASGEQAEQWARRAVEADPNNAKYWTTLGRVCCELRGQARAQEGIDCYRKALAIDPNNSAAHRYLGHALLAQRRFDEAAVHLRAALSGADDPAPVYYDLGQALVKGGHPDEGRKALALYQATRNYTAEVGRLAHEIAASPNDPTLHYTLIRFFLKYHQYPNALNALQTAVARFGPNSELEKLFKEVRSTGAPTSGAGAPPSAPYEGGP